MYEDEIERARTRFAHALDGRWATLGTAVGTPVYGVWVFRGGGGHREAKGSHESFRMTWLAPRVIELEWSNGDTETLAYDFTIDNDTTRQLTMISRGRAVFAFESAPLVRIGDF